ncbi:hypothetical protein FRC08_005121 [Ceratobasidium sp. 394]|nr:hypothetical protein FRC08_005121 [Ceratobasidium sp. 394]
MVPSTSMLPRQQPYRFDVPNDHPPLPPHAVPPPQPMTPVQSMASTSSLSPPPKSVPRKRRKTEDEPPRDRSQAEPRRLRRLHEACARCRGKKIKCDSKHPNCGACESAGVECKQEDRHRQTLQPRGHLEHLETQLSKCRALLARLVPGFELESIDRHLDEAGVRWPPAYSEVPPPSGAYAQPFFPPPATPAPTPRPDERSPFAAPLPRVEDIKGSDPNNLDLSSTRGLSKSFGVARVITKNLPTEASPDVREDLAVEGYIAGAPPDGHAPPVLNPTHWQHSSIPRSTKSGAPPEPPVEIWLPYDQARAFKIVDVYFRNLEFARPIFIRREFVASLRALYRLVGGGPPISYEEAIQGEEPPEDERSHGFASYLASVHDDPGFLCSVYLVFALGTLSETNHLMHDDPEAPIPTDWPSHVLFFNLALRIKPDLRVTISSLQALILLHWYLYTERNGRTLWRLVGNTIRLGVELGLHHDPTQQACFTAEEAHVRKCLWSMALIHDRGTSLLLGRPLAIADVDYNTPLPEQYFNGRKAFSDYIRDSTPIVSIQGDIITSLYRPGKLDGYTLMCHATRINQRFIDFRKGLPQPEYKWYFDGTDSWPMEQKIKLVEHMTDDHGMTVLKYFISRLLLLRTMFNASQLHMNIRQQALKDAVITSHNVLALHQHLTRSPDVAFFVSPIPIHLAAMVILYAEISNCIHIPRTVAKHDIHVALTIVPNRRWRWQRKDLHASHPLISALAERHYGTDFIRSLGPPPPPILMSEIAWPFTDVDSLQVDPEETVPRSVASGSVDRRREIEMRERERGRQIEREMRARRYTDHYDPGTPTKTSEGSPKESYHVHTPTSTLQPVQPNQIPDRLFYPMSLEENILNFRGLSHPHHLHGSEFIPQLPQPDAIPEVLARLRNEPPEGHVDLYQSAAYFVEEQYDREPYDQQMGFSGPTVVPSVGPIGYGQAVENSAWAPPLAR